MCVMWVTCHTCDISGLVRISTLWPPALLSAGLTFINSLGSLTCLLARLFALLAAPAPHPAMGYLDDIEFLETEEEEGRSMITHNTEIENSQLLVPTTAQFNFSRPGSPSIYTTVNSPDNRSIHQPLPGPYSGPYSASLCSFPSNSSTPIDGLYKWTPLQRKILTAHAEEVCRDTDVPADEQKVFIENAQVCRLSLLSEHS